MKFILLVNVEMLAIVDILTFISWINTPSSVLEQEQSLLLSILVFYEQLEFHAQLS